MFRSSLFSRGPIEWLFNLLCFLVSLFGVGLLGGYSFNFVLSGRGIVKPFPISHSILVYVSYVGFIILLVSFGGSAISIIWCGVIP